MNLQTIHVNQKMVEAIDDLFATELAYLRERLTARENFRDSWIDMPAFLRKRDPERTIRVVADARRAGDTLDAARMKCWRLWVMPVPMGVS